LSRLTETCQLLAAREEAGEVGLLGTKAKTLLLLGGLQRLHEVLGVQASQSCAGRHPLLLGKVCSRDTGTVATKGTA
jgi:hypothetical protein